MRVSPGGTRVTPHIAGERTEISLELNLWSPGVSRKLVLLGWESGGVEEDGTVVAVGHDPKRRARNGAVHVNRHLHRIERIAVTVNDQGRGGDAEHAEAGADR